MSTETMHCAADHCTHSKKFQMSILFAVDNSIKKHIEVLIMYISEYSANYYSISNQ